MRGLRWFFCVLTMLVTLTRPAAAAPYNFTTPIFPHFFRPVSLFNPVPQPIPSNFELLVKQTFLSPKPDEHQLASLAAMMRGARRSSFAPSTIQPSTIQPSTIQPSTIQPSTIQPSAIQPSIVTPLRREPNDLGLAPLEWIGTLEGRLAGVIVGLNDPSYWTKIFRGVEPFQSLWNACIATSTFTEESRQKFHSETLLLSSLPKWGVQELIQASQSGVKQVLAPDRTQQQRAQKLINKTAALRGKLMTGIVNSEQPWVGTAKLDHPIKRFVWIGDVPIDQGEAHAIYRERWHPTRADLEDLHTGYENLRQRIVKCENCRVVDLSAAAGRTMAALASESLSDLDDDVMAFLFGELRGDAIYFRDGSQLPLSSIRTKATYQILACNSYKSASIQPGLVGVTTDAISPNWAFNVGHAALDKLESSIKANQGFTQRSLVLELQAKEKVVTVVASNTIALHAPTDQLA